MSLSIQQLLNIEYPIIQAPMAGVQGSALAIAVSNAGGLGSLPAAMLGIDALREELIAIRAATDRPYNVNFFCHSQPVIDDAIEERWRLVLAPYYREYRIDPNMITASPARQPFGAAAASVLAEFKPPVVSFHFGLPSAPLLAQVKSWGAKILSSATTVAEARWLEAHGADAIIAQGLEAGGHRGHFLSNDLTHQSGLFALLPQIAAAVNVPVIAAGGIADAKGIRAAMHLGAAGVQIGTSYLLCDEATTSTVHRAALRSERAHITALTHLFTGRAARGIVNRLMTELGPFNEFTPPFPLAVSALAPLRAAAEKNQCSDFSPLWAGQNISGCKAISAVDLTRELAQAFE